MIAQGCFVRVDGVGHPCTVGANRDPRVCQDVEGDMMTVRQLVLVRLFAVSLLSGLVVSIFAHHPIHTRRIARAFTVSCNP